MATKGKAAAPDPLIVTTSPIVSSGNGDAERNQTYGAFANITIAKPWLTAFSVVDPTGHGRGIAWQKGPGSFSLTVLAPVGNGLPRITVGAPQAAREDSES